MGILDRLARKVAAQIAQADVEKAPRAPAPTILDQTAAQAASQGQTFAAAEPMPRDAFAAAFPPGIPIHPASINPPRDDTGRPWPRRFEYPVSWNLPGVGAPLVPWRLLRQFADNVDVVRRCIEIRKAEISQLEWRVTVRESAVSRLARDLDGGASPTGEKGIASVARARARFLDDAQDEIARISDFWQTPDRVGGLDFSEWLMVLLEEHYVLDAVSIYPRLDNAGNLHSLEVLDGSTIKPLLDAQGAPPAPPNPAYQQVLYGFPRGEFVANREADAELTGDDLIYKPRYRRSWTPYGYSNVEQALLAGDLYLKRVEWMRGEYSEGTIPDTFIKTDTDWTPEQLKLYERIINEELSGKQGERRRLRLLPRGMDPQQMSQFAERYNNTYDEFLVKLLCSMFDVMPIELGFEPQTGLGGAGFAEHQENSQNRRSTRPMLRWLSGILDSISHRYLGMPRELTIMFEGAELDDEKVTAETREIELRSAQRTLNEVRSEKGLAPYDFPEADMPYMAGQAGPVFVEGAASPPEPEPSPFGAPDEPAVPDPADALAQLEAAEAEEEKRDPQAELAEIGKFLAWAQRRDGQQAEWRDFVFDHVGAQRARLLNACARERDWGALSIHLGKARARQRRAFGEHQRTLDELTGRWAPRLRRAVAAAVDLEGVAAGYLERHPEQRKAAGEGWMEAYVGDLADATEILLNVYQQGYVGGVLSARRVLKLPADVRLDTYRAAAQIMGADGGRGLKRLLADAGVTIRSVAQSRLGDLAVRLSLVEADGTAMSVSALARFLEPVMLAPEWAEVVAQTETARAMTVATLDEYGEAGVERKEFLTASDDLVDEDCQENQDFGPVPLTASFPNGDPPVHPNCRCTVIPVVG